MPHEQVYMSLKLIFGLKCLLAYQTRTLGTKLLREIIKLTNCHFKEKMCDYILLVIHMEIGIKID